MARIHLNDEQRAYVQSWINGLPRRPQPAAYIRASNQGEKITTCKKPTHKTISNVSPTHTEEAGLVKTDSGFDALDDMPAGWAVVPLYDSGSSMRIVNACDAIMTRIWNCWGSQRVSNKPFAIMRETVDGSALVQELKANKIQFNIADT